jgi:hypothetical protein
VHHFDEEAWTYPPFRKKIFLLLVAFVAIEKASHYFTTLWRPGRGQEMAIPHRLPSVQYRVFYPILIFLPVRREQKVAALVGTTDKAALFSSAVLYCILLLRPHDSDLGGVQLSTYLRKI